MIPMVFDLTLLDKQSVNALLDWVFRQVGSANHGFMRAPIFCRERY